MTRRIGIEISSTAVRIAVVTARRGSRCRLVGWGEAPLPPGAVVDGAVIVPDVVLPALRTAAKSAKVARRAVGSPPRARLALSGLRAISRQVEMPPVPDAELDAAVRYEALDIVPFPQEKTLLSARRLPNGVVVGEPAPEGPATARVLLEAAHRDLVEPAIAVVSKAGFLVEGVELASSALVRALALPRRDSEGAGPEAIVSIGAELTTVVVHDRGEASFVRAIAGGGATITRAVSTALDVPFVDAEALKMRMGSSADESVAVPAEAVAAARDASAPLLSEIRSSVAYYASLAGGIEVARVVLVGGGAQLPGLSERLQFQMGIPVDARSGLERLEGVRVRVDHDLLGRRAAIAVGLALPDAPGRKRLDLLPPEIVQRRKQQRVERSVVAAGSLLIVGAAGVGALRYLQVHDAEDSVTALRGSTALLERDVPAYYKVQALDSSALADEQLGAPLVSHEVNWPAVLQALVTYTPSQVSTTSFSGAAGSQPGASSSSSGTSATTDSSTTSSDETPLVSPNLPASNATLGTISVALSGASYPAFQSWFDSIDNSKRFQIVQYSGLTASSKAVDFTAELDVTGVLHTSRLDEFQATQP